MKDMANNRWEVYIIKTTSGKLYTGITNNLDRRFQEHCTGVKGARFFRLDTPLKIVFRECHENRSLASKRESAIKKMNRQEKIALCQRYEDEED